MSAVASAPFSKIVGESHSLRNIPRWFHKSSSSVCSSPLSVFLSVCISRPLCRRIGLTVFYRLSWGKHFSFSWFSGLVHTLHLELRWIAYSEWYFSQCARRDRLVGLREQFVVFLCVIKAMEAFKAQRDLKHTCNSGPWIDFRGQ